MENTGLYRFSFSITDQYGGEMTCEFDAAPFFREFAAQYRNMPQNSPDQIEKVAINRFLNEQRSQAQRRLRSGKGRHSNPVRFFGDLLQVMRCVAAGGSSITQENVAGQMNYENASALRKQLRSHRIKWEEALEFLRRRP